ncbi:uncharacterized protein LOC119866853 [Canis lupus familiaris]|uniref:uncharacterized protein LOC119866853 n=1 Tax=Canis lupus familiaris TaxID=9615 RepID=UPI0018F68971|nr:uncharacterized protein LOC119866853 [Canis lupus familiaris]
MRVTAKQRAARVANPSKKTNSSWAVGLAWHRGWNLPVPGAPGRSEAWGRRASPRGPCHLEALVTGQAPTAPRARGPYLYSGALLLLPPNWATHNACLGTEYLTEVRAAHVPLSSARASLPRGASDTTGHGQHLLNSLSTPICSSPTRVLPVSGGLHCLPQNPSQKPAGQASYCPSLRPLITSMTRCLWLHVHLPASPGSSRTIPSAPLSPLRLAGKGLAAHFACLTPSNGSKSQK